MKSVVEQGFFQRIRIQQQSA